MRLLFLMPLLILPGCSSDQPTAPPSETAMFSAGGRDRLCISGERAGFIVYGAGDVNCSARGRLEGEGGALALIPSGDEQCRIPLSRDGDRIILGERSPACDYYCGPDTDFASRTFVEGGSEATDLAGDPLC